MLTDVTGNHSPRHLDGAFVSKTELSNLVIQDGLGGFMNGLLLGSKTSS